MKFSIFLSIYLTIVTSTFLTCISALLLPSHQDARQTADLSSTASSLSLSYQRLSPRSPVPINSHLNLFKKLQSHTNSKATKAAKPPNQLQQLPRSQQHRNQRAKQAHGVIGKLKSANEQNQTKSKGSKFRSIFRKIFGGGDRRRAKAKVVRPGSHAGGTAGRKEATGGDRERQDSLVGRSRRGSTDSRFTFSTSSGGRRAESGDESAARRTSAADANRDINRSSDQVDQTHHKESQKENGDDNSGKSKWVASLKPGKVYKPSPRKNTDTRNPNKAIEHSAPRTRPDIHLIDPSNPLLVKGRRIHRAQDTDPYYFVQQHPINKLNGGRGYDLIQAAPPPGGITKVNKAGAMLYELALRGQWAYTTKYSMRENKIVHAPPKAHEQNIDDSGDAPIYLEDIDEQTPAIATLLMDIDNGAMILKNYDGAQDLSKFKLSPETLMFNLWERRTSERTFDQPDIYSFMIPPNYQTGQDISGRLKYIGVEDIRDPDVIDILNLARDSGAGLINEGEGVISLPRMGPGSELFDMLLGTRLFGDLERIFQTPTLQKKFPYLIRAKYDEDERKWVLGTMYDRYEAFEPLLKEYVRYYRQMI